MFLTNAFVIPASTTGFGVYTLSNTTTDPSMNALTIISEKTNFSSPKRNETDLPPVKYPEMHASRYVILQQN